MIEYYEQEHYSIMNCDFVFVHLFFYNGKYNNVQRLLPQQKTWETFLKLSTVPHNIIITNVIWK